ncbi:Ig-like domain-containing protein [Roseinatronobacter monicus]|uniref:Archaellin n=1 Tax=Roseinatronobacter monicus TaxID=393481 RepID=A0A543K450_9RHOB|nr:Ig-like domain-containing protein [Roseinatronobacter monicus]TQM89849.1 archaellin [Roseinatronobacter monicus]
MNRIIKQQPVRADIEANRASWRAGVLSGIKAISLAAVTAAATLIGSGQAWAFTDPIIAQTVVLGVGCDSLGFPFATAIWNTRGSQGIVGLNGPGLYQNLRTAANNGPFNNGFGYHSSSIPVSDWVGLVDSQCANLTDINVEQWDSIPTRNAVPAPGFYEVDFNNTTRVGVVFTALDTNDGFYYRHEWALVGQSNQVIVNIRTQIPTPDTTPPSVTLSSTTTTLTGTDPFTVTATFDEDVTGFDDLANDVTITNGTVTVITGGPSVYTLTVTPTGAGEVTITVPAGAAEDLAGNNNEASNTLHIGNQIPEITERAISSFMLGRANQLASNQPRLTRFLRGEGCGSFNARGNDAGGSLEGCATQGNVWTEITASWGNGSSYSLGTIGAHQFINENFLLGGMVQFDRARDDRNNARGTGWMVGPYFAAKMAEQPLYFEGRLLYGQTSNRISPLGTYTDGFSTERWLAQLRAEGEIQQETITWIPLLDFTHTRDRSRAYTDSLGNAIGSQSVALTQLTSGMDFRVPLQSDAGSLELTGGASAIYSSTRGGSADFENGRGRVHMGMNWDSGQGTTVRAGTFYDGIGSRFRSVGGNLGVDIRF